MKVLVELKPPKWIVYQKCLFFRVFWGDWLRLLWCTTNDHKNPNSSIENLYLEATWNGE